MTVDKRAQFQEAVRRQGELARSLGFSVPDVRLEVEVESWTDWSLHHSLEEIRDWFEEQRRTPHMRVEDIPLNDLRGWLQDPDSGNLRHDSNEFFIVHGVRVTESSGREVGQAGWDQPIFTQVGYDGGILGILRKRFGGIPHYLIEAKAEPGNYELVQMSPTLQATFSNLKRAHGGRRPRFAEFFQEPERSNGTVHYRQWLSEDGGRLNRKRNLGMLVEIPEGASVEAPPNFRWLSMYQIKELLKENAWVNPHIRGIIAHL